SIGTLGGIDSGTFDGDWYTWSGGTSYWHINTAQARSGDKSAKMGPDDSGNYGNNELDQLYSPVFDLSGELRPHLRIWHQLDVADDGDDFGRLVLVRYDGLDDIETTMAELRSDTSPAGSWVSQVFDLTPFKSDPLRFNFIFYSNGDDTAGTGWLLDDIEVLDANPQITSISNNSRGTVGSTRTVSGANFGVIQGASTVTFAKEGGARTSATVNSWSDGAIEVVVPADAISGNVIVKVLGYESNGFDFRVHLGAPTLTDLTQM
ncbi:MAG TPA: hypothetical protein ENO21_04635, partial [Firmicutes bacterium]|nr:hypothetical protein [Bacillota bacterium]